MRYRILSVILMTILATTGILYVASSQSTAIMEVFDVEGTMVLSWVNTPTPWVVTATSALPFTPIPSATSTDTAVPPTDTAVPPTDTAVPSATPTQEDFRTPTVTPQPTPTFEPTIEPTAIPGTCWGTVNATTLNVRSEPWGNIIGKMYTGDYAWFDAKWQNGYWWWRMPAFDVDEGNEYIEGWVASDFITLGDTADCSQLDDITPQVRVIIDGPHTIIGEGGSVPLSYCGYLTAGKYTQGTLHFGELLKSCNPNAWIVCRNFTDGIGIETGYDAKATYERLSTMYPYYCDAIEIENERTPTNQAEWDHWSDYYIQLAQLFANDGKQVLAFSFGPGWPAFPELQYIVKYLRWVDDNPLPDGRYHGVASHAAVYAPWNRDDMPWVNEPYIAGRPYMIRDWIYATTSDNFDLYEWKGVWAITEVGLSDGYSGNWSAPYSCEEVASAYHTTVDEYQANNFPHALFWWNFGETRPWHSDHACSVNIWG